MGAIPAGVWAIASALQPNQLASWMDSANGADAWTFRIPRASGDEAIAMLKVMRKQANWLAVHAEWPWAQACKADAIIAGSRSMPLAQLVEAARLANVGATASCVVGAATHDGGELDQACQEEADFAFFSPIWDTPSKQGILAPRGLNELQQAAQRGIPIIALGGIQTPEQVADCRRHGAHAVAVLRAATDAVLLQEMRAAFHP